MIKIIKRDWDSEDHTHHDGMTDDWMNVRREEKHCEREGEEEKEGEREKNVFPFFSFTRTVAYASSKTDRRRTFVCVW
jgi:hypothetical protein